jgi:THAP domain
MVNDCVVYQCSNRTGPFSFHKFPDKNKFPHVYRQWLHKVNRRDFVPSKHSAICSAHFLEDDFEIRNRLKLQLMGDAVKSRPILKKTAVPSLLMTGALQSNICPLPKKRQKSTFLINREREELLNPVPEHLNEPSTSKSHVKPRVKPIPATATVTSQAQCNQFLREISTQCELGNETLRRACFEKEKSASETDSSDNESPNVDESFRLNSEEEDNSDSEASETDDDTCETRDSDHNVFLVFWKSLSVLFAMCQICGGSVSEVIKTCRGSLLTVNTVCCDGHNYTWQSQSKSRNTALGAINIVAAVYTCGLSFTAFKSFASALKLHIMSSSTYFRLVNAYVKPAIENTWSSQREIELHSLSSTSEDIWLSGDGQYDSPGYCGKFVTYSIMDVRTNRIIDFKVMQRKQTAGDLEKAACAALLK